MTLDQPDLPGLEISIRQGLIEDLHDIIGRLHALATNAKDVLINGSTSDWEGCLAQIEPEISAICDDIKHTVAPFVYEARPRLPLSPEQAFVQDLMNLGKRFSSLTRKVTVHCEQDALDRITPKQYLAIQKIVLNCLSNSEKHSRASQVEVTLIRDPLVFDKGVILKIRDNGVGNPNLVNLPEFMNQLSLDKHHGLQIICKEVGKLGATVTPISSEREGTTFTIAIPTKEAR